MKHATRIRAIACATVAAAALVAPPFAWAHGESHAKDGAKAPSKFVETETSFGRAIRPGEAKRTIEVDMADTMRFTPGEIRVKQGERVRFVVKNSGKVLHEMVLGTRKDLEEHAEMMRRFPNMEHEEPYMAHVDPGKKAEIHWQFTKPGEFWYGCLIPGHFEAGMIGKIVVTR